MTWYRDRTRGGLEGPEKKSRVKDDDGGGGEPSDEDEESVLLQHRIVVVVAGRMHDDENNGRVETNADAALRSRKQVVGKEVAWVTQKEDGAVEKAKIMVETADSVIIDGGQPVEKQGRM